MFCVAKSFVFSVLIVSSMSVRDYWWTEGLGGDARGEDADQALGLAGGEQKSVEERFLMELDENISVLSELVEEGMEQKDKQNKEEITTISGLPSRQESPPVKCSLGNTKKFAPPENVAPMPTYSTKQQAFASSTTIIPKGGKKSILNSVVKRNLNFSPKTKMIKHIGQPRPYPIPILPKYTGGARHGGEYDRQLHHTGMLMLDRRLLRDFKIPVKRARVFLLII
jgi:hypothetical protein